MLQGQYDAALAEFRGETLMMASLRLRYGSLATGRKAESDAKLAEAYATT